MKLFMFGLLLPLAMVATAAIRAKRENVLSFLNEKILPENITADPPKTSVKDQDSEDTSEARSTDGQDSFRGLDSDAMMIFQVLEKEKASSTWITNVGTQVGYQASGERSGPHGAQPARVERTDLSGEQTLEAQEADHLPRKQVPHSSVWQPKKGDTGKSSQVEWYVRPQIGAEN
ncbi:uncharacterized protein AB9W97_016530 [Spinachia spinachia]